MHVSSLDHLVMQSEPFPLVNQIVLVMVIKADQQRSTMAYFLSNSNPSNSANLDRVFVCMKIILIPKFLLLSSSSFVFATDIKSSQCKNTLSDYCIGKILKITTKLLILALFISILINFKDSFITSNYLDTSNQFI